ncbi:hypothetical protein SAMN04487916_111103 [Arthrobacter sp. ov407]|nr:hypothetical protein SAMN04487916_111103 [Arthrobacter sp. ov407]
MVTKINDPVGIYFEPQHPKVGSAIVSVGDHRSGDTIQRSAEVQRWHIRRGIPAGGPGSTKRDVTVGRINCPKERTCKSTHQRIVAADSWLVSLRHYALPVPASSLCLKTALFHIR